MTTILIIYAVFFTTIGIAIGGFIGGFIAPAIAEQRHNLGRNLTRAWRHTRHRLAAALNTTTEAVMTSAAAIPYPYRGWLP